VHECDKIRNRHRQDRQKKTPAEKKGEEKGGNKPLSKEIWNHAQSASDTNNPPPPLSCPKTKRKKKREERREKREKRKEKRDADTRGIYTIHPNGHV